MAVIPTSEYVLLVAHFVVVLGGVVVFCGVVLDMWERRKEVSAVRVRRVAAVVEEVVQSWRWNEIEVPTIWRVRYLVRLRRRCRVVPF